MNRFDYLSIIILLFLLLGIYFGYSVFPVCLAFLLLSLCRFDKDTVGVFLLMFGGQIGGITRTYYPFLPIYGILLNLVGIYLLRGYFNNFLSDCKKGIHYFLMVCVVFFIFYLLGDRSDYASSKMYNIVFHGSVMLFGYYVYLKSRNVNNFNLGYILVLTSITYISFVINYYSFSVGSIIDYEWFRQSSMAYDYVNEDNIILGYQEVGMVSLFGIGIVISDLKFNVKQAIALAIIAFQIIMISGARQAIFGFVIIIFLRFVFFNETRKSMKVISAIIGFIVCSLFVYWILLHGGEKAASTLSSGESDRDLIFIDAIRIFYTSPVFGVGLGGFATNTMIDKIAWPHNFFLEILCETGIIGSVLLFVFVLNYWLKNQVSLKLLTVHNSFFFLVVAVLFLRVMVSSDLGESIELFSAAFICGALNTTHTKS